jgi:hypothetical protein
VSLFTDCFDISTPSFVLSYPYYIVTVIWHPTLSVSVAVYVAKYLLSRVPTPKTPPIPPLLVTTQVYTPLDGPDFEMLPAKVVIGFSTSPKVINCDSL